MMLLPVASLGALIFPLALTDFSSEWMAGLVGVAAAFLTSVLLKCPMIAAIVIALGATTIMLMI